MTVHAFGNAWRSAGVRVSQFMQGRHIGRFLAIFIFLSFLTVARDARATLPQTHPWQIALRDYIGTLAASDFNIDLSNMSYQASHLNDVDEVYRVWQWFNNSGNQTTLDDGLRVASAHFTLANIEAGGNVNMTANSDPFHGARFIESLGLAWWAQWNYPGNPHRPGTANSLAAMRRAFVVAAVDVIMWSNYLETNTRRSDFLGGNFLRHAYIYHTVKDPLLGSAPGVRAAYETGLTNIFAKLEAASPAQGFGNINLFQLPGLWFMADAIDDPDLWDRARDRAHLVIDTVISQAGYHKHMGEIDASYMGIALRFLTWAAHLWDDSVVTDALQRMLKVKAYFTFPEPEGTGFTQLFTGPSHFNTATPDSFHNDQWGANRPFRDAAGAMLYDDALYFLYGGRTHGATLKPLGITSESVMRSDLSGWANNPLSTSSLATAPPVWFLDYSHYPDVDFNYGYDVSPAGFYDRARLLQDENNRLTLPPFARSGNFIETFTNDAKNAFVSFKIGDHGGIIFTDRIRDQWTGIAGLAGGGLSTFWTPDSGAIIMGMNQGSQSGAEQWTEWSDWAVHAISGLGSGSKPFSSARNLLPSNVDYVVSGATNLLVTFDGTIGGAVSAPNSALSGTLKYEREFLCNADGVHVTSRIYRATGSDTATEIWEMLPLHLRHSAQATDATIEFYVGGSWSAASANLTPNVDAVRATRYGQAVYLEFDAPRSVKLGPTAVTRSSSRTRNLMVDLLGYDGTAKSIPDGTAPLAVSYRLYRPAADLRIEGWPNYHGAPAPLAYGRHTGIGFGTAITNTVEKHTTAVNGVRQVCLGWELTDPHGTPIDSASTNQAVFTPSAPAVLIWNWTNQYELTLSANGNGSFDTPEGWYEPNTPLTVVASPAGEFLGWGGQTNGAVIDGNQISFLMDTPRSITAEFEAERHTFAVFSAHGTTDPASGTVTTNDYGTSQTASVLDSPVSDGNVQFVVTGWIGTGSVPTAPPATAPDPLHITENDSVPTFDLLSDSTLTWRWATNYWLKTEVFGVGSVTPSTWVARDGNFSITATPAESFISWSGDTGGALIEGNVITVPMTAPRSITAVFPIDPAAEDRFLGGVNDGWSRAVMAAPAGFKGASPADRFLGGSGSGWDRDGMAAPAGFKGASPADRFLGGPNDGWARSVMGEGVPAISLVKTVGYTDDHGASTPQIEAVESSTVYYFFVVHNAGNVTLTNVTLSDPHLSMEDVPLPNLAPGQSVTSSTPWTVTASVTNTASAAGMDPDNTPVSDTSQAVVLMASANPDLTVAKTVSHAGEGYQDSLNSIQAVENTGVTYWFVVANSGNLILTNVNLSDPHLALDEPLADLLPGQSVTSSAPWTVTASVTNTATATAIASNEASVDDTDEAIVLMQAAAPGIGLVKTVSLGGYSGGAPQVWAPFDSEVTYWFVVTNSGNVALTNVTLSDPHLALVNQPLTDLLPGQSVTSSAPWTVTASVTNTATAAGIAPNGAPVSDPDSAVVLEFKLPVATLSSGTNQVFAWTDAGAPLVTVTVTVAEVHGQVSAGKTIRIRVPGAWECRFETNTIVAVTGIAAGKTGPSGYAANRRALEIPVITDFNDGDILEISGLVLTDLHLARTLPERLELDVNDDGAINALDTHTLRASVHWSGGPYDGWDRGETTEPKTYMRPPPGLLFMIR